MRRSRATVALAWALTVIAAAGIGFGAARLTLTPHTEESTAQDPATYTVIESTVGSTSTFAARATWPGTDLAVAGSSGTITGIGIASGEPVDQGDILYTVDLRPVIIAQGQVPSFRDLSEGARGGDVVQLRQFLIEQGFLVGTADGDFTSSVTRAVSRWQRALGLDATGTVLRSDLVYAPELPTRIELDESVQIGATLESGVATARALGPAPELSLDVEASSEVPPVGTAVTVTTADHRWSGVISELRAASGDQAVTTALITATDGSPVCGDECGVLPVDAAAAAITATVELVAPATGATVPISALGTAADDSVHVVGESGERIPVEVIATDGSRAVVSGVAVDQVIRLFALTGNESEAP